MFPKHTVNSRATVLIPVDSLHERFATYSPSDKSLLRPLPLCFPQFWAWNVFLDSSSHTSSSMPHSHTPLSSCVSFPRVHAIIIIFVCFFSLNYKSFLRLIRALCLSAVHIAQIHGTGWGLCLLKDYSEDQNFTLLGTLQPFINSSGLCYHYHFFLHIHSR